MSEVDSRSAPSRGRSSYRGRGGFGRGGPRGGHRQANGTPKDHDEPSFDDQGEVGELKKQYSQQLPVLKDMFPDWTDVDLVFALQETSGDLETTILHITEGHVSQFSEIKKPKDRARSKAKETPVTDHSVAPARGTRGGRGHTEGGRGGRGRGDRARGVSRGGRGGVVNANKDSSKEAQPDVDAAATPATTGDNTDSKVGSNEADGKASGGVISSFKAAAEETTGKGAVAQTAAFAKKTWASMFSTPKPDPVAKKPTAEPQAAPTTHESSAASHAQSPAAPAEIETPSVNVEPPSETAATVLEPPHDALTEENVEHLPDISNPPATHTAASTVGSTDVRLTTPLTPGPQAPAGKALGGYASTALRATSGLGSRSSSFQRRVAEQQEAVVLPGHNSVDRAAVQFGSLGLNGDGLDVDEEREEPETRAQPPPQSPQAQPRASLPPAPAAQQQDNAGSHTAATPKQAPGLPPVSAPQQQHASQHGTQDPQQAYSQYSRYGQPEGTQSQQKSYDPFSQQTPSFDQYTSQAQPHGQQHTQQGQDSGFGSYSSAPNDYSQYYTADQQRYQNYYGGQYGQHQGQNQQDNSQQRAAGNVGAQSDNAFSSQQGNQQSNARYNESQSQAQSAPQSYGSQQHSNAQGQQSQQQQHQQSGYNSAFPYGHPYYNSPYATAYQNQFSYSQGNYGAPYGNKGGAYGQPHGYGAPSSYEHSSSPANSGYTQQSSQHGRESAPTTNTSDYGRTSTQPSSVGGSGFGGGISDYTRSQSGYQGQSQAYGSQQGGASDELKSYDNKTGPSPGLGQPGRPQSTTNSASGQQGQSGLPPPQSHQQQQQGFGQYPGFNQGSSYGSGLGGLGGQQAGGQGGYGGYGASYGQSYNHNQYNNRGWGGSGYGQH